MRQCPNCGKTWSGGEAFCPVDGGKLADVLGQAEAAADPWIGKHLDERYKIVARLGSGGMGLVYRATHVTLRTDVAIKILRDSESTNAELVERFRREAESASRIGHPGIVKVMDFGRLPKGTHYMVMELLEGSDLAQRLAQQGMLAPDYAVRLLLEACEALEAAHQAGIVHRDLKPENLFLARLAGGQEKLKIVDFGLAKMSDLYASSGAGQLTRPGTIFGTPTYMSPEQGTGQASDGRSDIYSLGCIAFEMLCGKPPFEGENYMGVITQHLIDPPPAFATVNARCQASPALEAAVRVAMAKTPDQRYATMQDFASALSQATGITLAPPTGSHRTHSAYPNPASGSHARPSVRPSQHSPVPGGPGSIPAQSQAPLAGQGSHPSLRPPALRIDATESRPDAPGKGTAVWIVVLVLAVLASATVIGLVVLR